MGHTLIDLSAVVCASWYGAPYVGRAVEYTLKYMVDPKRTVVALDMPPYWRGDVFHDYKRGRKPKPDGLHKAMDVARREFEKAQAQVIGVDGFEADDILATAAVLVEKAIIVSSDRDLFQCLREGVVQRLVGHSHDLITADDVRAQYGVPCERWASYRALVGDKSDRLEGVPGIGPKKASRLVAACDDRTLAARFQSFELTRRLALAGGAPIAVWG